MSICMIERTTVRLSGDLLDRARRKAAAEGRTLTSLIEEGLTLVVLENQPMKKALRILPPVSEATGGTMPGIELTKFSALEELDDLKRFADEKRPK